jgi:phospholipid/cholesterol/gamma-HCH transport system substrate-binding protein
MQRSRHDVWVGLFVLLGALAVLFLALKSANLLQLSFARDYEVTARFDNIGGLKPGAAVKSAGVVVGRVAAIDFDGESFQARVTLALHSQHTFPKDSSLKILTSGLLGEQYVGISPGADEANLVQGDRIGSTQSAVVLEDLISQFLYSRAAEPASGGQP